MTLVVAPEGTRKRTDQWKSGFYRIAVAAGVPIFPPGFDYPRKVILFDPLFLPTGDYEKDLEHLQSHFNAAMALKPGELQRGLRPGRPWVGRERTGLLIPVA